MKPVAFLDANVLYRVVTRSVLMSLAEMDVFQAKWSDLVHEEWMAALRSNRPDLDPRRIARTRATMELHVDDATVTGFEPLIETLTLPDPKDRHVLAASIHGGVSVIVTANLKDFPTAVLAPFQITAEHPDSFVLQLLNDQTAKALAAFKADRASLRNPPLNADDYVTALAQDGLVATAAALRPHVSRL